MPLISSSILAGIAGSQTSTPCFQGSCYHVLAGPLAWQEAREVCIEQRGDLVAIETVEEDSFLAAAVTPVWPGMCRHCH